MRKQVSLGLTAVIFIAVIIMSVQAIPLVRDMMSSGYDEMGLIQQLNSVGLRALPPLVGIGALQVIIPIIPAPALGVLTGMTYGVIKGSLIFMLGVIIGNAFVFRTIRQAGDFIKPKEKKGKNKTTSRFDKIQNIQLVVFFLFLIPFLSGVGPYLFSKTKITFRQYITAVTAGSIPMVVIYNYLGDHISSGNNEEVYLVGGLVVVITLIVLIFRKKIMEKIMGEPTEDIETN